MNIANEKIINSQNSVQVGSKHYAVNRKGYLIDFDDWVKSFTKRVAEIDHLKLTSPHWEAINRAFPLGGCKQACRLAGLPLHYCYSC